MRESDTPARSGIMLSTLAEDERARILARANGGRATAKKRSVKFGPKPKLAAHQAREAAGMVREGAKACARLRTNITSAIQPLCEPWGVLPRARQCCAGKPIASFCVWSRLSV
jgi:hypothetical protein